MSHHLRILENEVQIAALLFMALVYTLRVVWILRFRSKREKTFAAGNERAGIGYSMMNVAMPWAMESTRKNPLFYAQFVIFHLGVAAAITATFIIPYAPGLFAIPVVVRSFQVIIGAAAAVGVIRFIRRLTVPAVRLISTIDDFVSLLLMIFFLTAGVLAVPNDPGRGEGPLIAFFALTAFFLVYVPFSKISHYLYYPFARYFLGRTMGHRGVLPPEGRLAAPPGTAAAGGGGTR